MIRTRLSLEELNKIMAYPHCPCYPNVCSDSLSHWDMWQRSDTGDDLLWLATMDGGDNLFYYKYEDHVFVMEWEGVETSSGEVTRYIQELERARSSVLP